MGEICVVHLVWKPLGVEPLRRFAASYGRNPGGAAHRLVVVFNGFGGEAELGEYREVLAGVEHEWFLTPGPVQDIPAYFEAARRSAEPYVCFLNSHSELLDPEWLAKLYAHARRGGVGAVGATGSWTSHLSAALREQRRPSPYNEILADMNLPLRRPTFELSEGLRESLRSMPPARRLAARLYYYGVVGPYYVVTKSVLYGVEDRLKWRAFSPEEYDPFPAPHLRTNAFMLRRDAMLGLRTWEIRKKRDAYKFESGKQSMTNQLLRAGLKVLVVGRDGRAYEKEEWPASETLWQGEQRNLLVADNQTREYSEGGTLRRRFMSRMAWGWEAAPAPGAAPGW